MLRNEGLFVGHVLGPRPSCLRDNSDGPKGWVSGTAATGTRDCCAAAMRASHRCGTAHRSLLPGCPTARTYAWHEYTTNHWLFSSSGRDRLVRLADPFGRSRPPLPRSAEMLAAPLISIFSDLATFLRRCPRQRDGQLTRACGRAREAGCRLAGSHDCTVNHYIC